MHIWNWTPEKHIVTTLFELLINEKFNYIFLNFNSYRITGVSDTINDVIVELARKQTAVFSTGIPIQFQLLFHLGI